MKKSDHFEQALRLFAQLCHLKSQPPSSTSDIENKCSEVTSEIRSQFDKRRGNKNHPSEKAEEKVDSARAYLNRRLRSREEEALNSESSAKEENMQPSRDQTQSSTIKTFYTENIEELKKTHPDLGEVGLQLADFKVMEECFFIEIDGKKSFKFGDIKGLDDYIMLNCFVNFFISNGVKENTVPFQSIMKSLEVFETDENNQFSQVKIPKSLTSKESLGRSRRKLKHILELVSAKNLQSGVQELAYEIEHDQAFRDFLVYSCKLLVREFTEGLKLAGRHSYTQKYYLTKPVLFQEGKLEDSEKVNYKYIRFCLESFYLAVDSFCELIYIRKTEEDYHYKNISINKPKASFDRKRFLFYIFVKGDQVTIFSLFQSKNINSPWDSLFISEKDKEAQLKKKKSLDSANTNRHNLLAAVKIEKPDQNKEKNQVSKDKSRDKRPTSYNESSNITQRQASEERQDKTLPVNRKNSDIKLEKSHSKVEEQIDLPNTPGNPQPPSQPKPSQFIPESSLANMAVSPVLEHQPTSSPLIATSLSSRQRPKNIYTPENSNIAGSGQGTYGDGVFKFGESNPKSIYKNQMNANNEEAGSSAQGKNLVPLKNPSELGSTVSEKPSENPPKKLKLVGSRPSNDSFSFFDGDALIQGLVATLEAFDSTTEKISLLRNTPGVGFRGQTPKAKVNFNEYIANYGDHPSGGGNMGPAGGSSQTSGGFGGAIASNPSGASYRGRSFGRDPTHTASKMLRMAGKSQDITSTGRFASRTSGGIIRTGQVQRDNFPAGGGLVFNERQNPTYSKWGEYRRYESGAGTPSGVSNPFPGGGYSSSNYRFLNGLQEDYRK